MKTNRVMMGVFFWCALLAFPRALGDTIPLSFFPPLTQANFPLHRIGIEFVLTCAAAAMGGGMVTKWLLKRGWKFEKDVTMEERQLLKSKIKVVLPRLLSSYVAIRLQAELVRVRSSKPFKDELESILRLHPELAKELDGVPIEWVASELKKGYDSLRSARVGDDGSVEEGLTEAMGIGDVWCSSEDVAVWEKAWEEKRREERERRRMLEKRRRWRRWIVFFKIAALILLIGLVLSFWLKACISLPQSIRWLT